MSAAGSNRKRSHEALVQCITEAESRTRAEVVLALREASGNYRDIDYLLGFSASFLVLILILFLPHEIHPLSVPLPILLAFLGMAWVSTALKLGARLSPRKRRQAQVRSTALELFSDHIQGKTRERTGILIYISRLENEAWILADQQVREALGLERITELEQRFRDAIPGGSAQFEFRIGAPLRTLGVALENALPPESNPEHRDNQLADDLLLREGSGDKP
jgi:putative membrane protein